MVHASGQVVRGAEKALVREPALGMQLRVIKVERDRPRRGVQLDRVDLGLERRWSSRSVPQRGDRRKGESTEAYSRTFCLSALPCVKRETSVVRPDLAGGGERVSSGRSVESDDGRTDPNSPAMTTCAKGKRFSEIKVLCWHLLPP